MGKLVQAPVSLENDDVELWEAIAACGAGAVSVVTDCERSSAPSLALFLDNSPGRIDTTCGHCSRFNRERLELLRAAGFEILPGFSQRSAEARSLRPLER